VCPNTDCAKQWSQTFLCDTLTAGFRLGPYKEHREKVLFDREKARLPDTQEDAKRYKDARIVYEPLRAESSRLYDMLVALPESVAARELKRRYDEALTVALAEERAKPTVDGVSPLQTAYDRTDELRWQASKANRTQKSAAAPLKKQIETIRLRLRPMQYVVTHLGEEPPRPAGPAGPVKERKKFIMKCPEAACEGFLSQQYKCGLCDARVCSHCHVVKTDEGHVCDPALVATIKEIRKEAKPCPRCASLISKIDGCDQIWCTQCHTAFSWSTGRVETGAVHNAHYCQYMRETGQVVPRADNPGFGCNAVNMLDLTLMRLAVSVPVAAPLVDLYRTISHVRAVDLMQRRHTLTEYQEQEWRRGLRVQRLTSEITEAKWMDTLQRREKEFHKDTAWVQLLEMYTTVSLETMATLTPTSDAAAVETVTARLATIREYTLAEAAKVAKVYGCVVPTGLRPPKPVVVTVPVVAPAVATA